MDHNVNFFATCMGSTALQDSVISSIKLMQMYGAKITFKKKQTCCGQPAFNSGYFKEAKEVAFYNMSLFADNDYPIVIPAGSCAGMMSHDYKILFRDDSQQVRDSIDRFAARIYDESEYLTDVLKVQLEDKGPQMNVTFHVSCHSLRVQECIPVQKALIRQLKNVNLVDIPYEEECCGFGGTFSIKEPEISNAIVSEKIKHIKETGCKVVLAGDNGCILNISGALARQGITDIKVMNIYDFILKRVTGEDL
ncbi:(Fe-S)-binding protein [Anaerobiospirillum sp. NML120449]|uniref:(Fe-S)-binding protein n=1 Tax=Anaerobiospirillum sp. NML120449 TaxID=2932817 RepID=UPI001FF61FBD|nr:(Fe-S)-binding protein [Anaerobiospirillum sp. NML120449]MCK0526145.1 (Fe-S)-binding protein [Anaerobiospirillum sp. NML120449]